MKKEYDIFIGEVITKIKERIGDGYEVRKKEWMKNNGGIMHGVVILDGKEKVSPFIYTDTYYELYGSPEDITSIADEIVRVYGLEQQKCKGFPIQADLDSRKALERVLFKVINTQRNKALLACVPHYEMPELGLCMVFYLPVGNRDVHGTVLVHNSLMEMWHTAAEELMEYALQNTPSISGYSMLKMTDFLEGYTEEGAFGCLPGLYVLTNKEKLYGAGCMFYTGLLEKAAEEMGSGFYVLPSSVHEVILVADSKPKEETTRKLRGMVMEINRSGIINMEDFLSDDVYYYDLNKRRLSVAEIERI